MTTLSVSVAGIGAWSPGFAGWPALRAALQGNACVATQGGGPCRPVPLLLPPAERRRVPDGVAVALEVAREALATETDTRSLASVFASAHGELAIVDHLCATLACDPTLLSPTRFHHSVHNAAAGYWSIATRSTGPSTSLAAGDDSFALGLLEAATQCVAEHRPVLFVAFDTPAVGLLVRTVANTTLFGCALLLTPDPSDGAHLSIALEAIDCEPALPRPANLRALATSSPAARGLALLAALAGDTRATVRYRIDAGSSISVAVLPVPVADAVGVRRSIA